MTVKKPSRTSQTNKAPLTEKQNELYDSFCKILQPPPLLTIAEYADGHIMLPPPNPIPGAYDISKTPYVRPILEALSPSSPARVVIIVMGTQMGKTTTIQMAFMYYIEHSPAPMVFGFPNDRTGKDFFKRTINLIKGNESIAKCINSTLKGSNGMTVDKIEFVGGFLNRASGESTASLKSTSAQLIGGDEYDEWPANIGNQGSGFDLLGQRTKNYSGREKRVFASTPTNTESPILSLLADTTNEHFFITCPHCHDKIEMKWQHFKYKHDDDICTEVWYECQKCGGKIYEYQRDELVRNAQFIATNTTRIDPTWRGFWIPAYYGFNLSWITMVSTYLKALTKEDAGDYTEMTSFYNNILALPYEVSTERPDPKKMMLWAQNKQYSYNRYSAVGVFPKEVLFLTSGADIQDNRIEVEVKGWCRNRVSMSVEYYVFVCENGKNTQDLSSKVWSEYRKFIIDMKYMREDGIELPIAYSAIDRGHWPETVMEFCRSIDSTCTFLVPVLGDDYMKDAVSALKIAKSAKPGVNDLYYRLGVSRLKGEAYNNFRIGYDQNIPGICMFPCDYEEERFLQLTAEKYYPGSKGKRGRWDTLGVRSRNEGLDCHVYNTGMWYFSPVSTWTEDDYLLHEQRLDEMAKGISKTTIATKAYQGRKVYKSDLNLY